MAQRRPSTVLAHLHTKIDAITATSWSWRRKPRRSEYRVPLEGEPDSAIICAYAVCSSAPRRHMASFGAAQNIWEIDAWIELGYDLGGGDAGAGDRFSVQGQAFDDAQLLSDVLENPNGDGYDGDNTGIREIYYVGSTPTKVAPPIAIYTTQFVVRWQSDVLT